MVDNSIYVFRNSTIEPLFSSFSNILFTDYESLEIKEKSSIYVWFYTLPIEIDHKELIKRIEFYIEKLKIVSDNVGNESILILISLSNHFNSYLPSSFDIIKKTYEYNLFLYNLAKEKKNIKFIDITQFTNEYSYNELLDMRFYLNGLFYYSPKLSKPFGSFFKQQLNSILGKRKKCLILDMDNVLWGGVLGEDGISKIALGDSYPGNSYKLFQKYIKQIKNQGILLAICSKNNLNDVDEVWKHHPDMILQKDDFVSLKINWDDKAKNITDIAKDLNIGLDSLVFIDDNPRERELIKELLPLVTVPDYPEKPYHLLDFITTVYKKYFSTYDLTEEDKTKTLQYLTILQKKKFKQKTLNFSEYLRKLNITINIEYANEMNISRIAQMTQKTNQFNLTTNRLSEADIVKFINNGALVNCARVSDKFGDNGITVTSIVEIQETKKEATISLFLLSCRILGNGIEYEYLKYILNILYDKGIKKVFAFYLPTAKNAQTTFFYDNSGFSQINKNEKMKKYLFLLNNPLIIDDKYKIITQ